MTGEAPTIGESPAAADPEPDGPAEPHTVAPQPSKGEETPAVLPPETPAAAAEAPGQAVPDQGALPSQAAADQDPPAATRPATPSPTAGTSGRTVPDQPDLPAQAVAGGAGSSAEAATGSAESSAGGARSSPEAVAGGARSSAEAVAGSAESSAGGARSSPEAAAGGGAESSPEQEPEQEPAGRARRVLRRIGRLRLALLGLVLVLIVAFMAATLRLFVFPKTDSLTKADAIIMFDGIGGRKYTTYWLADHNYAPVVAVSTQDLAYCERTLPTISGVQLFCFKPDPATTRGEAEATERLATQHGWNKVIVVVGRAQETRARIRVDRCYSGDLEVAGVSPGRHNWPKTIVYEWGALLKAVAFQRSC